MKAVAEKVHTVHWLQLSSWQLFARLERVGFAWVGRVGGPSKGVWYTAKQICTLFTGKTNFQEFSFNKAYLIDKIG